MMNRVVPKMIIFPIQVICALQHWHMQFTSFVQSFCHVKELYLTQKPATHKKYSSFWQHTKQKHYRTVSDAAVYDNKLRITTQKFDGWVGWCQMLACCGCSCGKLSLCALFIICLLWCFTILCSLETTMYSWSWLHVFLCLHLYIFLGLEYVDPKKKKHPVTSLAFLLLSEVFFKSSVDWSGMHHGGHRQQLKHKLI